MTANKKSLLQTLKTFSPNFWVASFLQLMERWGFYGIFTLLPLYLVASTDEGGLGLSHSEKGSIIGNVTAIQYFLPLVFGVIADRIGYKLSLTISCLITHYVRLAHYLCTGSCGDDYQPIGGAVLLQRT